MEKKPVNEKAGNIISEKDEIILRQMEVIRSMTEHNLRRVGADFWGTEPDTKSPSGSGTPPDKTPDKTGETADETKSGENNNIPPMESMETLQAELDSYIGLNAVKQEVRSLINLVKIYQMRRENHLSAPDLSLHMVFTGNPGTGKTTIARLMARIYHSLGILPKGHLIETDRGGLVAGYVGQTAVKTGKVIESAIGGVLFIDEAYALSGRGENDFGQEAIDTLLKAMEDRRDEFIVIAAGYDDLMDRFIHSNPGLESRFNRFLHFDDYNIEELVSIFRMRCEKESYILTENAEEAVRRKIERENGPSFGNARGVRNLFEKALTRQANRLAGLESVTRERLMEITAEDIDDQNHAGDDKSDTESENL